MVVGRTPAGCRDRSDAGAGEDDAVVVPDPEPVSREAEIHEGLGVLRTEIEFLDVAEALKADLEVIQDSLLAHHGEAFRRGRLADLIRAADCFGFHLATVDLRQSSDKHEAVVAELLRVAKVEADYSGLTEEGRRTAPPLIEIGALLAATRAVENNNETAADLAYLRGRGTSLGGLRPKCTVVDDDGTLSIGKFPSVADERSVTSGF